MAKPTCASLQAQVSALTQTLNTYIALHQGLDADVSALKKLNAVPPAPAPKQRPLFVPSTDNYAAQCAARKVAMARFLEANPHRKAATLQELMEYAS